jgi:long-chain fatty acid transport protein
MLSKSKQIVLVLSVAVAFAASAFATDGYLSSSYGVKQVGMGGVGVALPGDSLAAATNPAGMVMVGDRFDLDLSLFHPVRSGTLIGNQLPPGYPDVNGTYDANRIANFYIPQLGYNHMMGSRMSLGVSIYGNGGMDTSYTTAIPLLGTTRAGVNLQQLFVAPTFAFKLTRRNAFGVSLNVAYQMFKAEGLQNFATSSTSIDPANVTDRGVDSAAGVGFRVGWIGKVNRITTLGATYQSRTWMGKLNRYRGLFAQQGGFDIPANFAGGIAVKTTSRSTVSVDVERILYSQVKSIADSGANQALLGSENGPGFGWHDITALKTGMEFRASSKLMLRCGYNHSGLPFGPSETFFNLLAPGIVQHHVTLGASWGLGGTKELSFAYYHAFGNTVNGRSSIPPTAGGGNANLYMHQDSVGIGFGWGGR